MGSTFAAMSPASSAYVYQDRFDPKILSTEFGANGPGA
jgi:hypothetical protein